MRIPDPKANTTTEAYLAYKAGYLEESELKPVLYEPYLHFDAWLAYWSGLTDVFPMKKTEGKNLLPVFELSDAAKAVGIKITGKGVCMSDNPTGDNRGWGYNGGNWYLKLPAGTYTISETFIKQCTWGSGDMRIYDSAGTMVARAYPDFLNVDSCSNTFTLNNDTDICVMLKIGDGECYIQLEEGSTATPYVPYSVPEMLCDEEALVAYLAGVTDTYPEDIKDPYDVRIVGYLKYLVSARWGRPEYPVNNEEFYLSTMDAPIVPSGDTPSSYIEMEGTAEYPFMDLKVYGDTSQNTYIGKNQFLAPTTPATVWNCSYTRNGDNSITVTTTGEPVSAYVAVELNLSANTQYTMSFSGDAVTVRTRIEGTYSTPEISHGTFSFTNGSSGVVQILFYNVNADTSFSVPSITLDKIQLEEGSTATSYEPYVGGTASPSPSYPQPVQVVTGRQLVNVHGKNLANLDIDSHLSAGVQITNNGDQTLTFKGKATSTGWPAIMETKIPVKVGKTYVMSIPEPVNVPLNFRTNLRNTALMQIPAGSTVSNSWSPSEDDEGWAFFTISSGTSVDFTTGAQIEEGSTPTDYQPYHGGMNEINLGKNLFDKNTVMLYNGYFSADGKIRGDALVDLAQGNDRFFYIPCEPNTTYTITKPLQATTSLNRFRIGTQSSLNIVDYASLNDFWNAGDGSTITTHTITTGVDAKYLFVYFAKAATATNPGGEVQDVLDGLQIEKGSTATPYAPYFEPIELCKIGDYQDYIYRNEDGDWYLHKAVRHLSFAIANMNNSEDYPGWVNIPELQADLGKINLPLFYFTTYNSNIAARNTGAAVNSNSNGVLFLQTEVFGLTQTQWKTLHPSLVYEIYYGITTSITDTKITNSELIAQLDALMECGSSEGKTFIKVTADSPNLPAGLIVEAAKYA